MPPASKRQAAEFQTPAGQIPAIFSGGGWDVQDRYQEIYRGFRWEVPQRFNMAWACCGRHALDRHRFALYWEDEGGATAAYTYWDLQQQANRLSNALAALGVKRGDRIGIILPQRPETVVAHIACYQMGVVAMPLSVLFGPDALEYRLQNSETVVALVDTASLPNLWPIRDRLPDLEHVLLIGPHAGDVHGPGVRPLADLMAAAPGDYAIAPTDPEDPAFVHFTSGTTGTPKGAVHVHEAVVAHHYTGRTVLDLRPGDVYWCTADPGWVTGTSYGLVAPLTCGVTCIVDECEFDVPRWYWVLERQKVSVWYTAPTALRMLMRAGTAPVAGHDLSALRHLASVGEPLNPEVVAWTDRTLGRPAHDTWWQTETGAVMVANYASQPIRQGSMGRPVPGIDIALVRHDEAGERLLNDDGTPVLVDRPDEQGEIAIRTPRPSMTSPGWTPTATSGLWGAATT